MARTPRTFAAVLAVLMLVAAALAGPSAAHRGPIPKYTYDEGDCKNFVDPIGILFYGRDASATRVVELAESYYDGMKIGDDSSQHFVTHGNCMSTQKAVDDGGPTQDRTHMRVGGIRSPSGRYARDRSGRIYSVGTPHTDDFIFECRTHVNPPNGFRDARRRYVAAFRRHRHKIGYVRLGNTRPREQCGGRIAQGDGLVAKIKTNRR